MSLGPFELGVLVLVVLLIFGPSRLPGLGKSVGEAIRSFKKGINTDLDADSREVKEEIPHGDKEPSTTESKSGAREKSKQEQD